LSQKNIEIIITMNIGSALFYVNLLFNVLEVSVVNVLWNREWRKGNTSDKNGRLQWSCHAIPVRTRLYHNKQPFKEFSVVPGSKNVKFGE